MELEDLQIENCGVEEIVLREDVAEASARFVFPKVTLLLLRKMPKLKWFFQGVHTSEWPLLKELEVTRCDQIELFTSKFSSFQEAIEQSLVEPSIQQPLFLVQEVRGQFNYFKICRITRNYNHVWSGNHLSHTKKNKKIKTIFKCGFTVILINLYTCIQIYVPLFFFLVHVPRNIGVPQVSNCDNLKKLIDKTGK